MGLGFLTIELPCNSPVVDRANEYWTDLSNFRVNQGLILRTAASVRLPDEVTRELNNSTERDCNNGSNGGWLLHCLVANKSIRRCFEFNY